MAARTVKAARRGTCRVSTRQEVSSSLARTASTGEVNPDVSKRPAEARI